MSSTFTIKQGDTGPALEVTLRDSDGTALDISGNLGVQFQMKPAEYVGNDAVGLTVDASATVVDATNGIVKYVWGASDTTEVGDYSAEFVVTASDATVRTIPSPSFILVRVVQDI